MPEMDGLEICHAIRSNKDNPYVYIILATACDSKQDLLKGMEAGADSYIAKPFSVQELTAHIRAAVRVLEVQEELASAKKALELKATHDPLTGLPNRLLLGEKLKSNIASARRSGLMLAVMFLDLNKFKTVNDTLGHKAGDELLKKVADRLKRSVRETDTVTRIGGDEFVIILSDIQSRNAAETVAKKILAEISKPFNLNRKNYFISASIGISLYPWDGTDGETLIRTADTAMYTAKQKGENSYHINTDIEKETLLQTALISESLSHALKHNEFVIHYQPKISLISNKVIGVEALLRWKHPILGMLYPNDFMKAAEDTGFIEQLEKNTLENVISQSKLWQEKGLQNLDIAINITPYALISGQVIGFANELIDRHKLNHNLFTMEFNAETIRENLGISKTTFQQLRDIGIRIAIDNVSSYGKKLKWIENLQIDAIKISRNIINSIDADPYPTSTIIATAHGAGFTAIADGVETNMQLEFLRTLHCDEAQGYFIGRPNQASEIEHLLMNSSVDQSSKAA
jgi:diguanylate cyclase (GGDEF)-like protein